MAIGPPWRTLVQTANDATEATMNRLFDKGLREELTVRERLALALEAGPMRRTAIKERAVIALCDSVLRDLNYSVAWRRGPTPRG